MPVIVDMSCLSSSCCFRYVVIDVDRDGDPQEHDSEVDEESFEPSITRNSYYLLVTVEGRKPLGSVEAVPLHGFALCFSRAPR